MRPRPTLAPFVPFYYLSNRMVYRSVPTSAQVDEVMAEARAAGATVTDPPRERFWGGYSGYFQDPDGHLWEIAWNPAWDAG